MYLPCPSYRESRNSRSRKDENTAIDRPKNYRAKVANASVRTTRSGPLRGFPGKIILALLRYFSRKPCLSGSICSKGPCSSTGCQSPDIHDLNKRSMQQTIIARQSPAPAWIPVIEKKRKIRMPEPHIKLPGRGATGPVPRIPFYVFCTNINLCFNALSQLILFTLSLLHSIFFLFHAC